MPVAAIPEFSRLLLDLVVERPVVQRGRKYPKTGFLVMWLTLLLLLVPEVGWDL